MSKKYEYSIFLVYKKLHDIEDVYITCFSTQSPFSMEVLQSFFKLFYASPLSNSRPIVSPLNQLKNIFHSICLQGGKNMKFEGYNIISQPNKFKSALVELAQQCGQAFACNKYTPFVDFTISSFPLCPKKTLTF